MINSRANSCQRGVVLIVVVGVLAILSLLAATFGMIARVELAASRNQTEYEMARQAAQAGSEYLINALQSVGPMTSGALPDFLPNFLSTRFGCSVGVYYVLHPVSLSPYPGARAV